ncbi:hypothetical protein AMJ80_00605 [bacterium SM23_31]|nr:MAG: hypothetical protein AMJ80_00605 [bacterium SM23_31]
MEVIIDLKDCITIPDGVISVGTFDGVHLAHQKIIQRVIEQAKDLRVPSTIVTFEPHPRLIVKQRNGKPVWILTTKEEKIEIFKELGPDRVVIIPFTEEFSQTSPESYVRDILCGIIGMQKLIIGHNHGFGRNRAGNIDFLRKLKKRCYFELINQDFISNRWGVITSSRIREFVLRGEISKASECLGYSYHLTGIVVPGDGIGHKMKYPTANIQVNHPNKCIPANGVYIVRVGINGVQYNGVMNIGTRPTLGKNEQSLEVNILDFIKDIYNMQVGIYFLERIRGEKKFDSLELLKQQINADIDFTRNYFLSNQINKESSKLHD